MAVAVNVTVSWYVATCSLVDMYVHFRRTCLPHYQYLEKAGSYETSGHTDKNTQCHIPEGSNLHRWGYLNTGSHGFVSWSI